MWICSWICMRMSFDVCVRVPYSVYWLVCLWLFVCCVSGYISLCGCVGVSVCLCSLVFMCKRLISFMYGFVFVCVCVHCACVCLYVSVFVGNSKMIFLLLYNFLLLIWKKFFFLLGGSYFLERNKNENCGSKTKL